MTAAIGELMLAWWGATAYWALACFALAFGLCYGGWVALLPTIVMDVFGARAVSSIIGCLYTGAGLGTLLGPWLAGALCLRGNAPHAGAFHSTKLRR